MKKKSIWSAWCSNDECHCGIEVFASSKSAAKEAMLSKGWTAEGKNMYCPRCSNEKLRT